MTLLLLRISFCAMILKAQTPAQSVVSQLILCGKAFGGCFPPPAAFDVAASALVSHDVLLGSQHPRLGIAIEVRTEIEAPRQSEAPHEGKELGGAASGWFAAQLRFIEWRCWPWHGAAGRCLTRTTLRPGKC